MIPSAPPTDNITTPGTRDERRASTRPEQRDSKQFAAGLLVMVIVIATTLLALWLHMNPLRAARGDPDDVFCCPDLLKRLWGASNHSLSPCRDFYRYTCYNWDRREKVTALDKMMLAVVTTPTYTGMTRSPAGKTIAHYYQSCLVALSGPSSGMRESVTALLDALKPPALPTPNETVHILFRIVLDYGMSVGFQLTPDRRYGAYITLNLSSENRLGWMEGGRMRRRQLGLDTFNRDLSTNVSWNDLHEAATDVFLKNDCPCCSVSEVSILGVVFPNVSLQDWNFLLKKYAGVGLPSRVRHCNASTLKTYYELVVEGVQPTSLALLVVEAGTFAWESFSGQYEAKQFMHLVCQPKAESLGLLWDIVVMDTLADVARDDIIRRMRKSIMEHILALAASVFPADDVLVMRRLVSNYDFLLASDLHLRDVELPLQAFDYWREELALKDYVREVRRHQRERDVPYYEYGGFKKYAGVLPTADGAIVLPSLYPAIVATAPWETAVNVPVVGADIARLIWGIILDNPDRYGSLARDIIAKYVRCYATRDAFSRPRLDLETIASVSRNAKWNKVIYSWGLENVTRSQFFYIYYVFLNLCGKAVRIDLRLSSMVEGVLSGLVDFLDAFGCPIPSNISDYCGLRI